MMNMKKPLSVLRERLSGITSSRKKVGIASAALGFLLTFGFLLSPASQPLHQTLFGNYEDELGITTESAVTDAEEESRQYSNTLTEETVQKGQSLYSVLSSLGLEPAEILDVTEKLKESFSARNFRPGKTYTVEKDPAGRFLCFTYKQTPSSIIHVQKDAESGDYSIWEEKLEYEIRTASLGGTISSTLSAELQQNKRYALIGQLQKLFADRINFRRDIQPGTSYNVLFEEKWLGDQFVGTGNILAAEISPGTTPYSAYRFTDSKGHTDYYDAKGNALKKRFCFVTPCSYSRVSSGYGYRVHPITRRRHFHGGVDLAARTGTPVRAVADGKIVFRGRKGAAGNMITINHANGYKSKYLHLSRFSSRSGYGRRVKQGEIIGYVGSTGRSTGPHLDFRMYRYGKPKNPLAVLRSAMPTQGVPKAEMNNFLTQIAVFRTQLETGNVLVAGIAENTSEPSSAIN